MSKAGFANQVLDKIKQTASTLDEIKLMHVCGTHEESIARSGIRSLLPKNIKVISGPGCPVCVTTTREVDEAIALGGLDDVIVTSFGDMMLVPGSEGSLMDARANNADVRVVYSASDATELARNNPGKQVVHIAIGFETTAPTTACELMDAPSNFSILCTHRTIPEAMDYLLSSGDCAIDGFIDPGHVSAIIGTIPYKHLSDKYRIPQVVAGFEYLDVLLAIYMLLGLIADESPDVVNEYGRVVREEGNTLALDVIDKVYTKSSVKWRGFPVIPGSGLSLREEYREYDARIKFDITVDKVTEPAGCRCGDVLRGLISPDECPLFETECSPANPVGPCMVSAEGACSIAIKYGEHNA